MATIDLITYDQKMVTPKDDALIHQFGLANGVLYGCEVTLANSNTLHITGGQGVIYGRQWEITEGDITVTLPASGTLKGRLYVKIDLSNTTNPIELLVQTDVTLPDLTDDDQLNVNNSVSELELCTFDVSSLTISNLVRTVNPVTDGSHADVVDLQEDISEINSSLSNKANLASPTFTGTPKAPTATSGTSTTQIATTAFVDNAVDNKIIYRDVTIASITVTGGSVQIQTITLPSVSGYSIWGATIRSAAGAANGQLIIVPKLSNNYITIYNPTSASITATNITIRYILVKN